MKKLYLTFVCFATASVMIFSSCANKDTAAPSESIKLSENVPAVTEVPEVAEYSVEHVMTVMKDPAEYPKVTLDEVREIIDLAIKLYENNSEIVFPDGKTFVTNKDALALTAKDVSELKEYTDELGEYRQAVADIGDIALELMCIRFPENAGGINENRNNNHIPKANFVLDVEGSGCKDADEAMDKYNKENVDIGGFIRARSLSIYYTDTATGENEDIYPTAEMNEMLDIITDLENKTISVN